MHLKRKGLSFYKYSHFPYVTTHTFVMSHCVCSYFIYFISNFKLTFSHRHPNENRSLLMLYRPLGVYVDQFWIIQIYNITAFIIDNHLKSQLFLGRTVIKYTSSLYQFLISILIAQILIFFPLSVISSLTHPTFRSRTLARSFTLRNSRHGIILFK